MFPLGKSQSFCRGHSMLLTVFFLTTLVSLSSSKSFFEAFKHHKLRQVSDCDFDMDVSAICYQCAGMDPPKFRIIYSDCCEAEGRVRGYCRAWYTEEPKRGRRDVWYY